MPTRVRVERDEAGWSELERTLARKQHFVGLDAETETKREAPVHGGYRSFVPGEQPIGGTLRRSYHTATFIRGAMVHQHTEGSVQTPQGSVAPNPNDFDIPRNAIVTVVGTNLYYAIFVELGTFKMAARPHLGPGFQTAMARADSTMARA